jgi:soluble lytic murein transglycosylase-like protein
MTQAPILRSSALIKALAAVPIRRASSANDFASALATAQAVHTPSAPLVPPSARLSATATNDLAHTPLFHTVMQPATAPTSTTTAGLPANVPFKDLIEAAARRNGVDPALLAGLVKQESNFNPNAQSGVGARGLTQLMPSTARGLGVTDPSDPAQSLEAGAKFLGGLLKQFGGDERLALAAYNAGPGAVQKYGGIPPYAETQRYVPKVLGYADAFRQAGSFI